MNIHLYRTGGGLNDYIIPLSETPHAGGNYVVSYNGDDYYAKLVDPNNFAKASPVRIFAGGASWALGFNRPDHYNTSSVLTSTACTLFGSQYDLGVQSADGLTYDSVPSQDPSCYSKLVSIKTAMSGSGANVTLVGNDKNNIFTINTGGASNILTGGLGKDEYNFTNGSGGIITDFGVGGTKDTTGTALDSITSAEGFNRDNPASYCESNDVLKVKGTVVEVAFKGCGDNSTQNKKIFAVYVTYLPDNDPSNPKTILLGNIVKPYYKASQPQKTDDDIAKTLKIWDTSTTENGSYAQISSTNLKNLFKSTTDSEYKGKIAALDALVNSDSNGIKIAEINAADDNDVCNGIFFLRQQKGANWDGRSQS